MRTKHNFPIEKLADYIEKNFWRSPESPENTVSFTYANIANAFHDVNSKAIDNRLQWLKQNGWIKRIEKTKPARYTWVGRTKLTRKKPGPKPKTIQCDCNGDCKQAKQNVFSALDLGNAIIETIDHLQEQNRKLSDEVKEAKYSTSRRESQLMSEIRHYKQKIAQRDQEAADLAEKIKALHEANRQMQEKLRHAVDVKFGTGKGVKLENGKVLTLKNVFKQEKIKLS